MRLFDAIIDASNRVCAGDGNACLRAADFASQLPVVALTCIDPRLSKFFPGALGLPDDQFIWLRNAGNVISGPLSSTIRSLALACVIKGGREIAIIGHTDCGVRKTTVSQLTDGLSGLGIDRRQVPENLVQYFGLFASERQNVICGVDFARQSPLIGPRIPVHGLMIDTESGKLQWVVNGYETLERPGALTSESPSASARGNAIGEWAANNGLDIEQLKLGGTQIGQAAAKIGELPSPREVVAALEKPPPPGAPAVAQIPQPAPAPPPRPIPAPPPRPIPVPPPRPIPVPPPIQAMPRSRRRS